MNRSLLWPAAFAVLASIAQAQPVDAKWPMVRYDRWGTARQPVGPDPSTQRLPWIVRRLSPNGFTSNGPAIAANGIVFYGTWNPNIFRKVNTADGSVLGAFDALGFIQSSPALGNDGTVYFTVPQNFSGDPVGRLFALNPNSMDYNWFFNLNQAKVGDFDSCSPIIGPDGSILAGSTTGIAYCFAPNGTIVWSKSSLGSIYQSMAMTRDDTKVIVAAGTSVTALKYTDGSVAWSVNVGSNAGSPGVAPDGTVVCGSDGGTIYGLNPDTGAVRWTWVTLDKVRGAPAFSATNAYLCSYDRRIYSIRTSDGNRDWSFTCSEAMMEGPTVGSDGRIYACSRNGQLTCVTPDGQLVWQVQTTTDCRGCISIDDLGRIYVPAGPNAGGLLMVSQDFFDLIPSSVTLVRGVSVSGTVTDLDQIDQQYYVARNGLVTGSGDMPIQIQIDTDTPTNHASRIDFSLVAAVNSVNLKQRVEVFDWVANAYVTLDTSNATLSDTRKDISITTNASRYVNGSHVRFKVDFFPSGPLPNSNYQARLDFEHLQFSPNWVP